MEKFAQSLLNWDAIINAIRKENSNIYYWMEMKKKIEMKMAIKSFIK